MGGWIKIYDKLLDWEWHDDPAMFSLWIHLLLLANYEDKKWHGITIKRGQFVTSRSSLSDRTGLSERQIRTCLARLRDSQQIVTKSTNKYTIVTICNYEDYQEKPKNERPANDQQHVQPATTTTEYTEYINNSHTLTHAHAHTHEGWEFIEDAKNSARLEAWCMQNHTTKETFLTLATQVVTEWELTEQTHKNKSDAKQHLYLLVKKLLKEKKNGNTDRKTHSEQISDLYTSVAATIARRSAEDDARKV